MFCLFLYPPDFVAMSFDLTIQTVFMIGRFLHLALLFGLALRGHTVKISHLPSHLPVLQSINCRGNKVHTDASFDYISVIRLLESTFKHALFIQQTRALVTSTLCYF